jgi:hypothetical protein
MTAQTEQFIRQLAEQAVPVRKLPRPYTRAAVWIALSVAYIGLVLLIMPVRHDLLSRLHDPLFVTEQLSGLATGIAAALAAFITIVPGYDRKWAILPLLPLAIWLGSLGPGCIDELNQFGIQGLPLRHNPWCVPFIVLLGAIPAVAMVVMLRRGAPLTPHLTAALGGLAAAGLANVGVRIIHPEEVSVMLLVWHVGAVMAISTLAGSTGEHFLNWRSVVVAGFSPRSNTEKS